MCAFLLGLRASVADHYQVPTGSMLPTVEVGDRVVVNKLAYGLRVPLTHAWMISGSGPAVGEVVVLDGSDTVLLKRVAAGPGDTVEVRGGEIVLNGAVQAVSRRGDGWVEQLGDHQHALRLSAGGGPDFGPTRVPDGHYFLLGDNRGDSRDSRYFGFVRRERILGRAVGVYWRGGPTWRGL